MYRFELKLITQTISSWELKYMYIPANKGKHIKNYVENVNAYIYILIVILFILYIIINKE